MDQQRVNLAYIVCKAHSTCIYFRCMLLLGISCLLEKFQKFALARLNLEMVLTIINSYRSAISSVHERIDGFSVGQHPTITRALKGGYHSRPPLPYYSSFWDVGIMLSHLKQLGCNHDLSLRLLTLKITMLMALTRRLLTFCRLI